MQRNTARKLAGYVVNTVNLVKKLNLLNLLQFQKCQIFPRRFLFWRALYVRATLPDIFYFSRCLSYNDTARM